MTDTYPLIVTRNRGKYGVARKLRLFADGVRIGEVKHGETVTVEVPRDAKQLYGKMDWGKSYPLDLDIIKAGDHVYANLWFTLNPLKMFAIPYIPCRIERELG